MEHTIIEFLRYLYNATYIPIHYFENKELLATFPNWSLFPEQLNIYQETMESFHKTIDYFSTEDFLYFGYISNPTLHLTAMIGPVSTTPLSKEQIQNLISKYAIDKNSTDKVFEFFQRTPLFTVSQFLNILALINHELNHSSADIYNLFQLKEAKEEAKVASIHSDALMANKENERYHDTYYFEQEYYGYLERGDVNGITEIFKTVPSLTEGTLADDSIRQAKNIFITTIALATRHAIKGGLDIETAYQLSDSYIHEVERMSDASQITILTGTAILDFTRRVSESKLPMGMSSDIYKAIQYISNHVNKDISVQSIAAELGLDRSTLSKKFSKELGFPLSAYITRRKLEEAKSLLHYTDKTISQISEYLCFSSQAYFQNVFKKKYDMTPREFRLKCKEEG